MTVAVRLDRRALGLLAGGHMSTDLAQSAVPALLPYFVEERGYSYSAAGALLLAATVGSSLIQPLFGYAADERELPALMPLGVALTGVGVALAGVAPSYPLTFAAIVVAGIGVAAFHPEGARYANYASGARKASGMSVFSLGGNVGFALGPVLTTGCVLVLGLPGTLVIGAIPVAVAGLMLVKRGRLGRLRAGAAATRTPLEQRDRWGPFMRLTGMISLRSCAYFGLLAFVPAYFVAALGASEAEGNVALTMMLVAGAAGTLIGGQLADRIGIQAVLVGCTAATSPLIALFLVSGRPVALAVVAVVGLVMVGTFSISVVLGQNYLPSRMGTASGITLGAAIGVGGAMAPVLGALADAYGVEAAMWTVAALPLPAFLLALTLPRAAAELSAPPPGASPRG